MKTLPFQGLRVFQMGALQELQNSTQTLTCLPNPYKLFILGDIWRASILPVSSSKYFYSW